MKKCLIIGLLATTLVVQYGFSQTFIGQTFIGGGLSFNLQRDQWDDQWGTTIDRSISSISIWPLLGFRFGIADVGVLLEYNTSTTRFSDNRADSITSSNIGVGLFGEVRFFAIDRFSIAGRGSVLYQSIMDEHRDFGDFTQLRIDIAPIFEYQIIDRLGFYTSVGRIRFFPRVMDRETRTSVISFFTGITLGFRYIF